MSITKAFRVIAVSLFAASVFAVSAPQNPSTTITINSYQCGAYSAFLTGNQNSNGLSDDPADTALFVVGDGHRYTLSQLSPSAARAANVDFIWQCSGASAAVGCTVGAKMTVNGMNTPNSLSLQVSGKTFDCVETKQAQVPTAVNSTNK